LDKKQIKIEQSRKKDLITENGSNKSMSVGSEEQEYSMEEQKMIEDDMEIIKKPKKGMYFMFYIAFTQIIVFIFFIKNLI